MNEIKTIPKTISKSENLSNFNIFTMNESENNASRVKALSNFFLKNTPKQYQSSLFPLLEKYSDIFAIPTDKMTQNNFYEQKLRITDNVPVFTKNHRLPNSQKIEIKTQVQKLLENDLIEPSQSAYNSPLILVPEKSTDGAPKWRMCVDYRQLNKKLIADKFLSRELMTFWMDWGEQNFSLALIYSADFIK